MGERRTILLVDDEDDVREVVHDILAARGHHVIHACDGAEALLALEDRTPDVIVLDVLMPGMNGWEFLACRALDDDLRKVPVVLVSGSADAIERTPSSTIDATLEKPFNRASLVDVVERVAARDARA